ncbi:serine/threonine-protein kinase PCRK1-like [Impatiens glandulifera]|uniref:serine/threonine-protein kinase PCRK1-like n=1 Tax=Impatiens glandulifera TaxID=253017 RepID=UPI001FB19FE8|nr:serine/threonine-protein kinase PCRK1-like [Impatiens glandulifera]
MKCFPFYSWDTTDGPKSKSVLSSSTLASTLTDRDEVNSQNTNERKFSDAFNSQNISDISSGMPGRLSFSCLSQRSKILRVFSHEELKLSTKSFSRSLMIGEGGFGPVHKGSILDIDDSNKRIDVAVKQLSQRGLQGHKEWVTEVNLLGIVEHQNLVKLIGYCFEDNERGIERLLVYEYMPNRSVQDHLSSRFSLNPIPWIIRLRIAQDAARGLAYLHEGMDFQIIFRDFKSSNILLDEQWHAKLSDFGLARLGPANGAGHVSTAVVGTIGYAAPEYIQTGHLTSKSDVWSYGVFLYELITGRRPLDRSKPKQEQNMLDWVRSHLSADMKRFEKILDPRLEGRYSLKSAQRLAAIANKCLARQAKKRPTMTDVLVMINQLLVEEEEETETIEMPETPLEEIIVVSEGAREVINRGLLRLMFCGSSYTSRKQIAGVANLDE